MTELIPIPSGPEMQLHQLSNRPPAFPELPSAWSASVLGTPFGDSIAPQDNYLQLAVAKVESATVGFKSWMRVRLYLTQDLRYCDFLFISVVNPNNPYDFASEWHWIDSSVSGRVREVHGPFKTTLRVPTSRFLEQNLALWGNRYPLMCTDKNPEGIDCDHWVIPTAGAKTNHGSWCAVRRDTGTIFRIFTMDSNNPMMLPFLGAYYIANFASFDVGVSEESKELVEAATADRTGKEPAYWNPLVTQQDVQRAIAFPIASAQCTIEDIQNVLPGYNAAPPPKTPLPAWPNTLFIQGWTIGLDLIPWYTRVCYDWAGDANSRQQSTFVGLGGSAGAGSYLKRMDTCLNLRQTDMPCFEWDDASESWVLRYCLPSLDVPVVNPDWVSDGHGLIMGQIEGNADFGLEPHQVLNLIAVESPGAGGQLAVFWVWFLDNGVGMLFSEAKYLDSLSSLPQIIDYNFFLRDAPISNGDFSNPCNPPHPKSTRSAVNVPHLRGHSIGLVDPHRKA